MAAERQGRPARLGDIAREAGVHVSTVSRVLNGSADVAVRPETRARIIETARRLRYRPNAMARGLRLQQTGTLGVLGGPLRNPLWSQIIHGAFDQARSRGYVVLVAERTDDPSALDGYERLVSEARIDGMLVLSGDAPDGGLVGLAESGFPTVFAGRGVAGSDRNVLMDEEAAVRLAVSHLSESGHSAIGYIEGPAELDTTRRRIEALARVLGERGLSAEVCHAPHSESGGYAAVEALLPAGVVTACVIAGFSQTIGGLAAARRAGLQLPAELRVVTYDDEPILDYIYGSVTSIRMPLSELGSVAVDTLIDQIEGASPKDVVLATPPELVTRANA